MYNKKETKSGELYHTQTLEQIPPKIILVPNLTSWKWFLFESLSTGVVM